MTATYNTVQIGDQAYDVYADIATADDYLNAEFTAAATRWRDATLTDDTEKARALVSATRLVDRQTWPGSRTSEYQVLEWPRTGTGISGIDEDVVPSQIEHATILLAAEINNGNTSVIGSDSTDTRTKRQKAGSVEIEYFRDLDGGPRFPTAIQELLAGLFGGRAVIAGSIASGVDECSDFTYGYSPSGVL